MPGEAGGGGRPSRGRLPSQEAGGGAQREAPFAWSTVRHSESHPDGD